MTDRIDGHHRETNKEQRGRATGVETCAVDGGSDGRVWGGVVQRADRQMVGRGAAGREVRHCRGHVQSPTVCGVPRPQGHHSPFGGDLESGGGGLGGEGGRGGEGRGTTLLPRRGASRPTVRFDEW